ncbi:MAG: SH3 domain-containing protein [Thermomicrobiales bacterium]
MSRIFSVCLCAVVAFVSVAGAALLRPVPVLAANGTLTMATPLQDAPDPSASMIVLLAPGAVISIDGPPVDGFYPVSVEGYSGWMRGETMTLTKDIAPEEDEASPPAEDGVVPADGEVPIAQDASEDPLSAAELAPPPGDTDAPAGDVATSEEPAADTLAADEPVVTDNAGGDDGVTQAPDAVVNDTAPADPSSGIVDPAAAPVDAGANQADPGVDTAAVPADPVVDQVDANANPIDPADVGAEPASATPAEVTPADGQTATQPEPELISATVTQPPLQTGESVTTTDPAAAPAAATETPVVPPADVTTQTLADPSTVAATPASETPGAATSTPTTTAEPTPSPTPAPTPEPPLALNGPAYVLVDMPVRDGPGDQYGLVFTVPAGSSLLRTGSYDSGWISVQYKEVYGWSRAEQMSEPIEVKEEEPLSDSVDTKEPKPGSGVAFTTSDLSLRDGPSATEDPIVVVPAGSRVILTGVMEGDFQRVTYGDYVGWVSNAFLENPDNPAPNGEATGKQENYSRKQIVKYIYAAADRYGQSRDEMLRVATCESNLDPYAVNPSGSYGLFQFIRSTWKSTPYGDEDIFDPEANAMAAGWMWKQGRKSEWVCQ